MPMLWESTFGLGLNSPELFKAEGDKKVIHQLVSLYNQGIEFLISYRYYLSRDQSMYSLVCNFVSQIKMHQYLKG